jgi:hypothetical protein
MPAALSNRQDTSLSSYYKKKWNHEFSDMEEKVVNNLYSYYRSKGEWPATAKLKEYMNDQGDCGVNSDIAARVTELRDVGVLQYSDERQSTGSNSEGYRVQPGDTSGE